MARGKSKPGKIIGIIVAVVAVFCVTGGGLFFMLSSRNHLAKLPEFPVETYLEAENLWSYQNADYKVDGEVEAVLLPETNGVVLISFKPMDSDRRLPVLVSQDESSKSIRPRQELTLKVTLGETHELRCSDYVSK
ncbi:MAG: hypothetical protein P1V20_10940 [Verrucomicrobiales bacterium]|nr:hypothetical protein [Verrucomicrobiales bacterium]